MEYRKGSHSVYELKYHIIFCTKYRYKVLRGDVADRVREVIRQICSANDIIIESGSMSPDHVNLLVSVPPGMSLSKAIQYIKGKTSRVIQGEFSHIRKRYWGQHFWSRGYFVVTVGNVNEEDIKKYIEGQEEHHKKDDFKISEY